MTFKIALCCGAAALAATGANAATINLIDLGGVTGSQAEMGFKIAANYWATMFTNNAVINLGVKFAPLAPNVIGSTGSRRVDYSVANWQAGFNATKSNSALDQAAVLPTLNAQGGFTYITNGVDANGDQNTADAYKYVVNGDQTAAKTLYLNTSVIKAIGGNVSTPSTPDGNVTFSSNFGFDFDPTDGISANTFDFIGVAIHEIGHALGFVSGTDLLDQYSYPNGPGAGQLGYNFNDTSLFSSLDMFRYSSDPTNLVPGSGPALDLSVGGTRYFSIDGGQTALFGNTFSTGSYNGDGNQASHWKDTAGCQIGNGIMDPTFCFGQTGYITALDIAAFDAMGWNTAVDALNMPNYLTSTADIYRAYVGAAVPEPSSWMMMGLGFGLLGFAARRSGQRRVKTVLA